MHNDKDDVLCTQSDPTCHTSKLRHRNTILNTAAKNPLRTPTYFDNPIPAPFPLRDLSLRPPLHRFLQLPLTAPLRCTRFSARYAPRSDRTIKFRIPRTKVDEVITRFIINMCRPNDKKYSTNFDQCHVTMHHKDYSNRQQKRSSLFPP